MATRLDEHERRPGEMPGLQRFAVRGCLVGQEAG